MLKFSTLRLPAVCIALFCALALVSSCSSYHKVAVWYKYRNDFHLPKAQEGVARNTAAKPAPTVVSETPTAPVSENQAVASADSPKYTARERRLERRARRLANRFNLNSDGPALASTESGPSVDRRPVWERQPLAPQAPQRPMERPFSVAAIVSFIIGALAFIGALAYSSPVLFAILILVALVLAIIGLMESGPSRAKRGFGFAIAGLIMSGLILLAILL